MIIIKSEEKLCMCCMEEHDVKTVLVEEQLLKILKLNMKHLICIAI